VIVASALWWTIGYVAGVLVVLAAALLLLAIIALAKRIERQARDIQAALEGAVRNTEPLFELGLVNHTLESLTRAMKRERGEEGEQDERGLLHRLAQYVPGWSA
jgi:hypothetical protein